MAVVAHLVALSALLAACGAPPLPAGDASRPDVVLVSVDSLRADHLGAWGYARPTSPFLDSLAAEGLRFTDARSAAPWTLPSHLTMLTGKTAPEHGVVDDALKLADDVPMVQERLRAAGYATGGFVSTIYVSGAFGFSRGFDRYEDYGITEKSNLSHPVRASKVLGDARKWVAEAGEGKPVFLFLHLYDVHYPYEPPGDWAERFGPAASEKDLRYRQYAFYKKNPVPAARMETLVEQYDECVAYVDDELRQLREAWTQAGRAVTFVVTADHGEEFGERGSWGHAHTLAKEQLHVPLIVAGPGIAPAVREELVGTVDLAATIAGLAGVPWTEGGVDVRGPVPARPFVADTSRFDSARLSLEEDGWRLDVDLAHREETLYDRRADPLEAKDVAAMDPDRVLAMRKRMYGLLGEPWVLESGTTIRSKGFFWQEGSLVGHRLGRPGRFGLYPPDAEVAPDGGAPIAGTRGAPRTGPVRYEGTVKAGEAALTDETRKQLEALGYVQGEGEAGTGKAP